MPSVKTPRARYFDGALHRDMLWSLRTSSRCGFSITSVQRRSIRTQSAISPVMLRLDMFWVKADGV